MKQRIIEAAEKLFFQYGVRSVSMDDVAKELTMSKKTLYQYFTNKDELVAEVTDLSIGKEKMNYGGIAEQGENAINELFLLSKCIRQTVSNINPSLIYDLKKYHPNAFDKFQRFKYEFIKGSVLKNIERGIAEGHYRPNLNATILATLRVETIQLVFDGVFSKLEGVSFIEVQMQLFEHFVNGLLTQNGRELYEKYLSEDHNKEMIVN